MIRKTLCNDQHDRLITEWGFVASYFMCVNIFINGAKNCLLKVFILTGLCQFDASLETFKISSESEF